MAEKNSGTPGGAGWGKSFGGRLVLLATIQTARDALERVQVQRVGRWEARGECAKSAGKWGINPPPHRGK